MAGLLHACAEEHRLRALQLQPERIVMINSTLGQAKSPTSWKKRTMRDHEIRNAYVDYIIGSYMYIYTEIILYVLLVCLCRLSYMYIFRYVRQSYFYVFFL